jgi:hypothetical protein
MTAIPHGTVTEFAYVTTDIDRAIGRWVKAFGAGPFYKMALAADYGERTYRGRKAEDSFIAALGFSGTSLVEFIQPTNDAPSVFQEVLKERGDFTLHHVMPDLRPLSATAYDALDKKYQALGYVPACIMTLPGLGRSVQFDARPYIGSFVEILEVTPALYRCTENMHDAHVGWDGARPMREFSEVMPAH